MGTTIGSPLANAITNRPTNPAGEGVSPALATSMPMALAPGWSRPVISGLESVRQLLPWPDGWPLIKSWNPSSAASRKIACPRAGAGNRSSAIGAG